MKRFLSFFLCLSLVACTTGNSSSTTTLPILEENLTQGAEQTPSQGEQNPPVESTTEEETLPPLTSPMSGNEVLVPLQQGTPAPFPGVLLNVHAVAWLEAEPEAIQERAQTWVSSRFSRLRLLHQAEIDSLNLRLATLVREHQIALEARNQQIESLNRINNELRAGPVPIWEQILWIGGALILGGIIGLVGGLLAN